MSRLKTPDDTLAYSIKKLDFCKNYRFRNLYLLYFRDLNGYRSIQDAFGFVSSEQKREDVEYLHNEYLLWEKIIKDKQNGTEILNFVSKELTEQRKVLRRYCQKNSIGNNRYNYLLKSLTLHSKYIFYIVSEYFQELSVKELIIEINNNKILIDAYTYVHILSRHYASYFKEHQDKSYHQDESLNFKKVPDVLSDIINCFKATIVNSNFNNKSLYFKMNNENYAIWFKKIIRSEKGAITQEFLRVETFYPIKVQREVTVIRGLELVQSSCGYGFYQ